MEDYDYLVKVILLGDAGVGKSSILIRYLDDNFFPEQQATIGCDMKIKYVQAQSKKLKVALWDTAGQERFRTLISSYYRGAHGIVLCFDVTKEETFTKLEGWLTELDKYTDSRSSQMVKLLVGNKIDLEEQRIVTYNEAQLFSKKHGMMYIETSAKTRLGIQEAFQELFNKIVERPQLLVPKQGLRLNQQKQAEEKGCSC